MTDKPLIAILMAVYEPNMVWLKEQLLSLNRQDYPHLRLHIRDDCSPSVPFEAIQQLVNECITAFPYTIERNETNLGSNGTFQRLTAENNGTYFAYCDQDDIWLKQKLTTLQQALERENALLVCSDMYTIDANGKQTGTSIRQKRKAHVFYSGAGLASRLLFKNWVTGCTMLVRTDIAKGAIPFCPHMVHDQYIALCAADKGNIISVEEPLIQYRLHSNNQTGLFAGVINRETYVQVRVKDVLHRIEWIERHFPQPSKSLSNDIINAKQWINARYRCLTGEKTADIVWKYRRFGVRVSLFEIAAPHIGDRMFMKLIELARNNKI